MSDYKNESTVEKHCEVRAEELVDTMYDLGFLHDKLDRKAIRWLQDYIALILQQTENSAVKASKLLASIRPLLARVEEMEEAKKEKESDE